jgi:hypothetical protein
MKLADYLEQLDQTDPCELEKLIDLSRAVVADSNNLRWESSEMLAGLIAEKLQEGVRQMQVRSEQYLDRFPRHMPSVR